MTKLKSIDVADLEFNNYWNEFSISYDQVIHIGLISHGIILAIIVYLKLLVKKVCVI